MDERGISFLGIGLFAFWFGLKQYSLKKAIEYAPTYKAVAVAPGLAELSGTARRYDFLLVSPFSKRKCLYYCTELFRWSGSGKSRKRVLVKRLESKQPFYLEDETGSVLVMASSENIGFDDSVKILQTAFEKKRLGKGVLDFLTSFKPDTQSDFYKFVKENAPELSSYSDDLEICERTVDEGRELFVLGKAKVFDEKASVPELVVYNEPGSNFCMVPGNEKQALSNISLLSSLGIFGGPILTSLGVLLLTDNLFFALLPAFLLFGTLGLMETIAMYNGLVLLKNSVGRADANIDALLQKRADLLPQLAEIAKGYSKYEQAVNVAISEIRKDAAFKMVGKELFSVAEAYPELAANKPFLYLQQQLAKMENQIAASRQYYLESVTLYNTKVSSFPYLLFAQKLGFDEKNMESK